MPLTGVAPTEGEISQVASGTLPQTPARRSSSSITATGRSATSASLGAAPSVRKAAPSYGPTDIGLDDIDTPSSSEPSEAGDDGGKDVAAGAHGVGVLAKALQEGDEEDVSKVATGTANGGVPIPPSRTLSNAPRGSMVCCLLCCAI